MANLAGTDIHPEIRAFWEKWGRIDTDELMSEPSRLHWWVYPGLGDEVAGTYIASQSAEGNSIIYYLNGETYGEDMALRLIRLVDFW